MAGSPADGPGRVPGLALRGIRMTPKLLLAPLLLAAPAFADAPKSDVARPAEKTFEVEVVADIDYYKGDDADKIKHKLDLYLPKGQKDFPVLFFVHGGAWKSGDRKLYGKLGETFAKNGVGTVIISYRLSPKVQHPAHIEDVAKAFAWTVKNIAKHGGNV